MKEFIEIPFGAKDSELGGWEYNIPEGYTASIENGKIIVKKEETKNRIMKELTIEEKAARYDKAIKIAESNYDTIVGMDEDCTFARSGIINTFHHMFPELKKSEEERIIHWIRKELESKYVIDNIVNNVMADKALAWLEKQGEKIEPIDGFNTEFEKQVSYLVASVINREYEYTEAFVKWAANGLLEYAKHEIKNDMGISEATKKVLEDNLNKALEKETPESCNEFLEKQGNCSIKWQKNTPDNKPAINHTVLMKTTIGIVEGEWHGEHWFQYRWSCRLKDSEVLYWMELSDLDEQGEQKPVLDFKASNWYVSKVDGKIHDMTYNPTDKVEPRFKVKYAGSEYNVLEVKDIAGVTFYRIEDEPNHIDYVKAENCEIISGYATKENGSPYPTKSAVFSEQKPTDEEMKILLQTEYEKGKADAIEQKSAWSEDDEKAVNDIMWIIEAYRKNGFNETHIQIANDSENWLKSLKERYTWKPSDEQLDALDEVCETHGTNNINRRIICNLLEQLKKL